MAFAGKSDRKENITAAVAANIWMSNEKCATSAFQDEKLQYIVMDCEVCVWGFMCVCVGVYVCVWGVYVCVCVCVCVCGVHPCVCVCVVCIRVCVCPYISIICVSLSLSLRTTGRKGCHQASGKPTALCVHY